MADLHDSSDNSAEAIESLDIATHKLLEEALEHEKNRTEQYLNIVEEILVALDTKAKIVRINRKGYKVLGYEEGELIGMDWIKTCIRSQDYEKVSKVFDRIIRGEIEPVEYLENYVLTKDGEERCIAWHNVVLRDNVGRIIGTLSSGEDITEQKKAENALRISEEKYRAIFENTGTAMLIIEEDSLISLANREFEELTGYSKGEIEGKKKWTEFIAKADLERMLVQHRLRREDPDVALKSYEFTAINRSGQVKNILMNIGMIPGTRQSVASLLDITERKNAEKALRDSEEKYSKLIENSVMGIGI
jgi:PAS domain S-box-containing protein